MTENKANILLVEDDQNLGFVVQDALKRKGYAVHLCRDGKEGLRQFNEHVYDLCVLDVMLPHKDGFSLAEDIRSINAEVPIIFLTAKSQTEDRIAGFKAGGDDYLTKPFSHEELVLRIEAILRRTHGRGEDHRDRERFELGTYTFDHRNLMLSHPSEERKLTKKEADVLRLLCMHQDQVLTRELVLNMVWGDDTYFLGRSLDVFISRLRKYLKLDENVRIVNVHGVGFKLQVE
ncbi:MAG: response regulator transcription factor [Flavobacteriales bacterium]|jgi:DNA-binding response OmpR family regulator|nr:response regulator transcription factor [Flavobacteriales bacterium]MBK6549918.1 response regulator transcription factor [Flavobacteriales bacterium]MBK6881916.1 response regulator transcription factor [Flavobacteriales bacterium]MBK7102429.1 response regulator transcription factor [Flavobacteriales bacterium]MBK7113169.1 response regulator transcription factor [Flavobacteriales bacterium]